MYNKYSFPVVYNPGLGTVSFRVYLNKFPNNNDVSLMYRATSKWWEQNHLSDTNEMRDLRIYYMARSPIFEVCVAYKYYDINLLNDFIDNIQNYLSQDISIDKIDMQAFPV